LWAGQKRGEDALWSRNGHKGFTPKLRGSKQHFSERFGGFPLHARQQVTVRIQCHPCVRVAESFRNDFRMNILFQKQCRMVLLQIVEAVRFLNQLLKNEAISPTYPLLNITNPHIA
jgi:hypothetical protein